jgi:Protein of unknown function (DUF732)
MQMDSALTSGIRCLALLGGWAIVVGGMLELPCARADAVAYLVNVTLRPGYSFATGDDALAYGRGICGKVAHGRGYPDLIGDVQADFNTADQYQASYLITQAVNELCPEEIWQLRNSAAHYRPAKP